MLLSENRARDGFALLRPALSSPRGVRFPRLTTGPGACSAALALQPELE